MIGFVTREVSYGFSLRLRENSFLEKHLLANRTWQPAESELIRTLLRPGDVAVDAGSHAGYFSRLMAECGARVIAFEPNPMMAELTRLNCAGLDVEVRQAALSDVLGEQIFYLPSAWNDGWGSLAAADEGDRTRPITVATCRLDAELPAGRIRLVKMDVEGAEVQALRGLGQRLTDVDRLIVECVDIGPRVAALGSTVTGINAVLVGFRPFCFDESAWLEVPEAYSTFDGDFMFVNPRALSGRT